MLEGLRLDGKVAVITGAGRGLGKAMAKALAQAGADLVCAARTEAQLDDTVQELRHIGGKAIAVPTDVTDSAQVNRLLEQCIETYGKIDIMVANAGGGGASHGHWEFWEYPDDAFEADVGPIAVSLAGTGAGYVTGQIFPVDGGLTQHL